MPIYFFTQANLMNMQTDLQAFGPLVGDLEKKYRVCSLHTFSNDAIAYSIAKGDVKIQEITGGTTVNLILKPENPAVAEGLKIKYIIYRGIKKNSLIAGNIIAATGTNDLTTTIWAEHQKMITATASSPTPVTGDPSQDILGINLQSLPGTDLIEKLFTHNPNMVNPTIDAGKSIGLFDKTGAGLEIVMEGYFLDDTLASVRALDHVIDAGTFANTFANKAIREKVTNYLEPCAFYGYIPISDLEILNSAPIPAKPSASDFFVQVTKAKFFNYNVMYVDIRNQSDLSHIYYSANYDYKIYDLLFKTSPASTPVTLDYATNKWPVFTCRAPATGLTLYTPSTALFTFGFDKEIFEIKPVLYFPGAVNPANFGAGTQKKYFITETNFFTGGAHFFTVPPSKDRINFDGVGLGSTGFYASGSNPGGVMANYLRFSFFREIDQTAAGTTPLKFPRKTIYDNLFGIKSLPAGVTVPANSSLVYKTGASSYAKYEIKDDPADTNPRYISGLFESFVAFESNRVTLFAMLVVKHDFWGEYIEPNTVPVGEKPGASFFKYLETINKSQVELAKHELKITTTNKPAFLNYTQVFDKIASVSKPFVILGVSLTTAEYAQIATAITTATLDASLHPVFLQFHNVQDQTDLNNVRYKKTQLNIRGLTAAAAFTNGLTTPLATPVVYSTEALFFSKDAAALEPIALTAYKRTNFGTLKVEVTPALQAALSNLSIEKQNLFTELMKLPSFTKYANKIAAAAGITKLKFKHEALSDALAETSLDITGLPDNYSIIIKIHPPFLIEGSPVAIVKTILHEMIHASVDFEAYAICKNFTSFTAAQRTLLKNSRNPNGRIYAELYCKFGEKDKPPVTTPIIDDNICERSFSHNFMALYARMDIQNSAAEYETNNTITRNDVAIILKDKFLAPAPPPPGNEVPMTITKLVVYTGLSWQGIERTREYRRLASVDAASKQLYQLYSVAASHEINALNYNLPPSTNSASQNKPFFEPVTTPTVQICTP